MELWTAKNLKITKTSFLHFSCVHISHREGLLTEGCHDCYLVKLSWACEHGVIRETNEHGVTTPSVSLLNE